MLEYLIKLDSGEEIRGNAGTDGIVRIHPVLPEGKIKKMTASMNIKLADGEKIFMNGYQTWTYCPEREKDGRIRGIPHVPKALIRHFGIDRYGDYFFTEYPNKKGVTHGWSYCYFRNGGNFRLIGSLDERPGYTGFRFDAGTGVLTIERDCAGISCAGEYAAFDLIFAEGTEDEVFDAWFAAMGVKPRTDKRLKGYSSWYNRYQNISAQSIEADLAGCVEMLDKGDLFQIDDGWEPFVGDWLEADDNKFPLGMKDAADKIHEKGMLAGLWLAPFVCQKGSRVMTEHPDWLLKPDGKPWYCGCNWGGFWALDIDNPEVIDYLGKVFSRVLDEWGFDLVKLDFLYAAAPFGSKTETRGGRMIRAMELLRKLCGDKLILGCGVPLMPAFGLVDYCRISCDVGLDWNNNIIMRIANRERVSTKQAIGNSIFRRQLNDRAFLSDPDVFFLRDDNIRLSAEQKKTLCEVNALFGGIVLCSDNMAEYSEAARAEYARMQKLKDAENIKVNADNGLSVNFLLDGKSENLEVKGVK